MRLKNHWITVYLHSHTPSHAALSVGVRQGLKRPSVGIERFVCRKVLHKYVVYRMVL